VQLVKFFDSRDNASDDELRLTTTIVDAMRVEVCDAAMPPSDIAMR
jgi:hypothetical protein